jgi:hypothetical protein
MYNRILSNLSGLLLFLSCSVVSAQQTPIEQHIDQLKQQNVPFHGSNLFTALPDIKLPENELQRQTQRLRLQTGELAHLMSLRPAYLTLEIPWHNQILTLDLYQQNILAPGFEVKTGQWETAAYTPGVYYRGVIRGAAGSLAAISLFEGEIIGVMAHREWGNLNLGRRETRDNTTEYLLFEERLLPVSPFTECHTEDTDDGQHPNPPKNHASADISGCVQQFFEADYALYQNKGSIQNTINYVSGFFNAVATIYNNETISIALSQVYVWTTPDPYDYTDSGTALNTFESYRTTFNGALAHLVSLAGSGAGGRAYLDVICATGVNYAFSGINSSFQTYPTYSWTVNVVAHEMGHNFSSRHTHWCGWSGGAIDNCGPTAGYPFETPPSCSSAPTPTGGGTVMSYCHLIGGVGVNLANGFGPLPGNAIRAAVTDALNSSCIPANCPTITCTAPVAITFSSIANTSASISWNTISGATGYNLQHRLSPAGAWTTVNNINPPYSLTGLTPNTVYEVQVQTICSGANVSPYATGGIFKTITSACAEPSALSASPLTNTSVSLNWTENGTATSWQIQWGAAGFSLGTGTLISTSTKPYTLAGLSAATSYDFYVRATCGGATGNSTWVGPLNFITPSGNDLSSNAIQLFIGQTCTGNLYNNTGATLSAGEFSPSFSNGGYWNTPADQTVWFWFNAPSSGTVYITTDKSPQGSNDDTQIALYSTPNPATLNDLLVSNEDGGLIGNSYNTYGYYSGLTPNAPYYIQVDGWDNVEGSFCIEVHESFDLPEPATCTSYTQTGVNGSTTPSKWYNIYTKPNTGDIGLPVAAIRSSSNLGTVTVQAIKTNLPIASSGNGVKYMQRYYAITNTTNTTAARDIRLFYTDTEFTDFQNAFVPVSTASIEDLNISRYNTSPYNCTPTNNAGSGSLITAVTGTAIGGSGYFYLQFNSGQGEFATILSNTAVPVELLTFEGKIESEGNILTWSAATEKNIRQYTLERSASGAGQWETVGATPARSDNETPKHYSITDAQPWPSTYYRLLIPDTDGGVQYSNILHLERQIDRGILSLSPNPAREELVVAYQSDAEHEVRFRIFGSDGRLVLEQDLAVEPGTLLLPMNISSLPAGLYYLHTNMGKGLPFVKQ